MTTEEMMEFYKNAWDKERDNSNRLCMLKDDAIEKMIRLQEQLDDANKTIDYYDKKDFHYMLADGTVMGAEPAHKYKIKWGVK